MINQQPTLNHISVTLTYYGKEGTWMDLHSSPLSDRPFTTISLRL